MTEETIGIDISKDTLDVPRLSDGEAVQFNNSNSGFLDLTRWLAKTRISRIVYEPTGVYHRDFERALLCPGPRCSGKN